MADNNSTDGFDTQDTSVEQMEVQHANIRQAEVQNTIVGQVDVSNGRVVEVVTPVWFTRRGLRSQITLGEEII